MRAPAGCHLRLSRRFHQTSCRRQRGSRLAPQTQPLQRHPGSEAGHLAAARTRSPRRRRRRSWPPPAVRCRSFSQRSAADLQAAARSRGPRRRQRIQSQTAARRLRGSQTSGDDRRAAARSRRCKVHLSRVLLPLNEPVLSTHVIYRLAQGTCQLPTWFGCSTRPYTARMWVAVSDTQIVATDPLIR